MRKLLALSFCLSCTAFANAQDFLGIRTSNYNGVSSVFYNPANIADSRHRWDFNLVSAGATIGNNKASFKLSDLGKTLNLDSLKDKVFSSDAGSSNGFVSAAVYGPSFFST